MYEKYFNSDIFSVIAGIFVVALIVHTLLIMRKQQKQAEKVEGIKNSDEYKAYKRSRLATLDEFKSERTFDHRDEPVVVLKFNAAVEDFIFQDFIKIKSISI
jgi:uncharacterized membrane protein